MRATSLLAVVLASSAINGAQLAKAQSGSATGGAMSSAANAAAPDLTGQTDRLCGRWASMSAPPNSSPSMPI